MIDPLPSIDAERSYPAGQYALHAGGLWRAKTKTNGMDGWACVMRGIADVREEWEGRLHRVTHVFSDGEERVFERRTEEVIYRGVFRDGETYERGDAATYAGSYWIAQRTPATDLPGTSDHWRLAVKRGRDGAKK